MEGGNEFGVTKLCNELGRRIIGFPASAKASGAYFSNHAWREKTESAVEDLCRLRPAICLEEKMGARLGGGAFLQ